jgi:hypothetical protein
MLDDNLLDQTTRLAVFNIMLALYREGIKEIHLGGLMRIMGVVNEVACQYDDEVMILDSKFVKYVEQIREPIPPDQTLH